MWDQRYAGKLAMGGGRRRNGRDCRIVAGAADPSTHGCGVAKVKDLLLKQKPLLRFYWDTTRRSSKDSPRANSSPPPMEQLRGGAEEAGACGQVHAPQGGILTYCCGLVLAKGAPHSRRPTICSTP